MAMGIDSCAHAGALEAGGLTVAVLGNGVDVPYPRAVRGSEEIVDRGLVIGELPDAPAPVDVSRAQPHHGGPRRDDRGGRGPRAFGIADHGDHGRQLNREVGAVPGRVGSSPAAGPNGLLRDGAHVIRDGQDVLDALLGPGVQLDRPAAARGSALEPDLVAVLDPGGAQGGSADSLAMYGSSPARWRPRWSGSSSAATCDRTRPGTTSAPRWPCRSVPGREPPLWPVRREGRSISSGRDHHRDLGFRRGRQDPGGPEGVRPLRVHGTSAIVALTAQNTHEVVSVETLPRQFILDQVRAVASTWASTR